VLFEQSDSVGGQWNQGAPHSGVWPAMVTNTSRVTTQFSDLPLPGNSPMFLHNRDVLAYLRRYSETFSISSRVRLQTRVERIDRGGNGEWLVTSRAKNSPAKTEAFSHVIIASGRYHAPRTPEIPGIESFPGAVDHTFRYRGVERYRGKRVLVAGCAISAVEIAPELAMGGAVRVFSCMRRQRYVVQRVVAGVPIDVLAFTRFGVVANEHASDETRSENLKRLIVRTSGTPEQWGGLAAHPDPYLAGLTQGQYYLPLVSERRIIPKPWIESIDGDLVRFSDGTEEQIDAILFGTGFHLGLPFLPPEIHQLVNGSGVVLNVYRQTFHPKLPGLAFLGLFHQSGPYFPSLELQARWIVYNWSGLARQLTPEEMSAEMVAHPATEAPLMMSERCIAFAREAGVEPDPEQWQELKRALWFGPLSPVSFRLNGPDALPDAAQRFAREAAEFGVIDSTEFTTEQREMLSSLEPKLRFTANN
jgi:hypothetical protein